MIRHLRLWNWRSYDSLEVNFEPGTTFVVAPNGVGKTSLVYALTWALYGDDARGISPKECIRAGTEQAGVEISLELSDGSILTIDRRVKRRGSPTVGFRLNEEDLDEAAAEERLESEFGIDLPTAARLSTMLGGGHIASGQTLDLKSHLYQAFGVTDLLRASDVADATLKEARKTTKALRASYKQRIVDRATVETDIERFQRELGEVEAVGAELEARLAIADQARQLASEWTRFGTAVAIYQNTLSDISGEVSEVLADEQVPSDADRSTLKELLARSRAAVADRITEATSRLNHAQASSIAAERGLELLEGDHTTCPTCLRAIDSKALTTARTAHLEHADRARHDETQLRSAVAAVTTQLRRVDSLIARLEALSPPEAPQSGDVQDVDLAEQAYRDALDTLNQHNASIGGLRAQVGVLRQQLKVDDQALEEERRLIEAFRREGVAAAAADALMAATDQITSTRIEPIAREVQWRWKQLFNDGGLHFGPDGVITRLVAGEELTWDSLSGGERTWARLITHLLVIEASTMLPFAWFDEPLEHLDPKLRRAVAGYLADVPAARVPKQIIVTTYEHALASQLAADHPQAHIVNIRRS